MDSYSWDIQLNNSHSIQLIISIESDNSDIDINLKNLK
jgi:hypothetical protein